MREITIKPKGHLPQDEVSDGISPVFIQQEIRLDNVSERLGHLLPFHGPPAVGEYPRRWSHSHSHQHGGPVNGMRREDVLADQVGGVFPKREEIVIVRGKTGRCYVVDQGVEPDISDIIGIEGYLHSPVQAALGAANAKVLQRFPEKSQDLVPA